MGYNFSAMGISCKTEGIDLRVKTVTQTHTMLFWSRLKTHREGQRIVAGNSKTNQEMNKFKKSACKDTEDR